MVILSYIAFLSWSFYIFKTLVSTVLIMKCVECTFYLKLIVSTFFQKTTQRNGCQLPLNLQIRSSVCHCISIQDVIKIIFPHYTVVSLPFKSKTKGIKVSYDLTYLPAYNMSVSIFRI